MASLPDAKRVTYGEWVRMPEAVLLLQDGFLRTTQILAHGKLEPLHLPNVQVSIADIWPD